MRKINFVIFIILDFLLTANCFAYTIIAKERGTSGDLSKRKAEITYGFLLQLRNTDINLPWTRSAIFLNASASREDDFARWPTAAKELLLRRWDRRLSTKWRVILGVLRRSKLMHEGFDVIIKGK